MIQTRLNVRDRVLAGVAFLDETVPDWRERINLDTLDVSSGQNCVLGQVFAHKATESGSGFLYAIETFGGGWEWIDGEWRVWQTDRGFALDGTTSYQHENTVLNRAWRLVLAA